MKAAIDVLATYRDSVLVVGDMAELGDVVDQAHVEIGQYAKSKGVSHLFACGYYAAHVVKGYGDKGFAFSAQSELINYMSNNPFNTAAILVKGSRSAKMEKVVAVIRDMLRERQEETNTNKSKGNVESGGGLS